MSVAGMRESDGGGGSQLQGSLSIRDNSQLQNNISIRDGAQLQNNISIRDSSQLQGGMQIREPSSSFTFPNFGVIPDTRRKNRRGQLQKNDGEEKAEVEKSFPCLQPGCPRTFTSKFKLVRHVLIHSGERRFQCNSCGRRFHRKDHLKNHLQIHNPNKIVHCCDLCQKTYCSLLSYRKHIALHAAEAGDLVCKLCGKMLADRESILQHLKVHTGSRTLRGPSERKFPCDRCDRSFFTKKDVKRHLVVHTGKRDFVCQYCPQRFGRKDHLVRHTKKSHSITNGGNNNGGNNSSNSNTSPPETLQKFNAQPTIPHEIKDPLLVPSPLPDMSRLVISPSAVPPMMDPSLVEPPKQDSYLPPPPPTNLVQPSFSIGHLTNDSAQNLGRYSEPSLLPVSQYVPMNPTYPGPPIMPHHYINMSTSTSVLSDLLPPMTASSSSFPTTVSLDMGNPSLPHFSQAFQ